MPDPLFQQGRPYSLSSLPLEALIGPGSYQDLVDAWATRQIRHFELDGVNATEVAVSNDCIAEAFDELGYMVAVFRSSQEKL